MAGRFKTYFFRGLAVLLPTVLTIWILVTAYGFIQKNISIHINRGLVRLIMFIQGENGVSKDELTRILVEGTASSIMGFIVAVVGVCVIGAILASVVGKAVWKMVESFIMNTPVLRRVYPYVKQITDFVLTQEEKQKMFSRVVAVEYPRNGIWSLGFLTGSGIGKVADNVKRDFFTVFIPTSPTPFTGFVIMVPKKQTIELDMTMEEAFRFVVSGGVIAPDSDRLAALPKAEVENENC